MKEIMFDVSGPMICGSAEAEENIYQMAVGKSGWKWFVKKNGNRADNIYASTPNKEGFAGRTIGFELDNGETVDVVGPWKSNSETLFNDTGIDVRDQHTMQYVISMSVERGDYGKPNKYIDILESVLEPTPMRFEQPNERAKHFANKLGKTVRVAWKSNGGGCCGYEKPDTNKKARGES